MNNLISRQAAIDIVRNRVKRFTTACVLAVTEIEQLPSVTPDQKWTPCTKRLPDVDGRYLIAIKHSSGYAYYADWFAKDLYSVDDFSFSDKKGESGWYNYDHEYGYCMDYGVEAWMPIPEYDGGGA